MVLLSASSNYFGSPMKLKLERNRVEGYSVKYYCV
jgi:hypothetical protein